MPIQIPGIDAPLPNLPTPPSGLTGKLLSAAPWLSKLGFIGRIAANPIGNIALFLLANKLLFGRGGSHPDEKLLREHQQNAAVANAMLMADESEQRRMQGLSEIGALGAARSGAATASTMGQLGQASAIGNSAPEIGDARARADLAYQLMMSMPPDSSPGVDVSPVLAQKFFT